MKGLLFKLGFTLLLMFGFLPASAYDFEVDGIYYTVTSFTNMKCEVSSGDVKYNGVVNIPAEATCNNRKLSVTGIGSSAFKGCSSLESVTIPNSVTSIGSYAFSGCSSLASITIPNSVTSIEWYAFYGCSSLVSVTIPNSVTSIGSYAFYGCRSLTSVIIPNSVTSIDEKTFYGCSSLTSVTIPISVTSIGSYAFSGCSSLASITIPNSVTSIEWYAFYGCRSLTSVTIPNSVKSINDNTFDGCSSLTSVTIPNSVTYIRPSAFENCSSLVSVIIPNSVTSIGISAFSNCSSLESINLSSNLEAIVYGLFENCESLNNLEIPGSVNSISQSYHKSIGDDLHCTFKGCKNLRNLKLTYSDELLKVGKNNFDSGKFYTCNWDDWTVTIKELYIDRPLAKSIPVPNLEKLVVGEHMEEIQVEGLSKLDKLTTIECLGLTPPTLPQMTNKQYMNLTVLVPTEALATYQAHQEWGKFWNLQAAGIDPVIISTEKTEVARYNLSGTPVDETFKGFVIVLFSDGSTKKILQ